MIRKFFLPFLIITAGCTSTIDLPRHILLEKATRGNITTPIKKAKLPAYTGEGFLVLTPDSREEYLQNIQPRLYEKLSREGVTIQRVGYDLIVVILASVIFEDRSHFVNDQGEKIIADIASIVNDFPDSFIAITGYTNDLGDPSVNKNSAFELAQQVAFYLTRSRVNSVRLFIDSKGAGYPIGETGKELSRFINRRVEIVISPVWDYSSDRSHNKIGVNTSIVDNISSSEQQDINKMLKQK
ncbi:MAG: hypothetical protein JJV93_02390 [Alphaproteobacteria bacterium]|nr:hypothetical protein [Alphaproteobacteria bacterium]MBL0718082.1 hypothetical protein [Alphaproteobacteria bacterium]